MESNRRSLKLTHEVVFSYAESFVKMSEALEDGLRLRLIRPPSLLAHDKERSYSCAMSMKASAAAQAMSEESLATKADMTRLERELSVVKWMTGAVVAGVASLLLRAFSG